MADLEPVLLARLSTALDTWHAEQLALWDPTAEEGDDADASGAQTVGFDEETQRMLDELGYVE